MDYRTTTTVASGANISYSNVPMNQPADSIEPSKVRDGITTAEQFQSEIHEHIAMLEKRLDTVLRPVPPQGSAGLTASAPTPACSHVVGRLNLLNEGLHGVVQRLRELRERIEV